MLHPPGNVDPEQGCGIADYFPHLIGELHAKVFVRLVSLPQDRDLLVEGIKVLHQVIGVIRNQGRTVLGRRLLNNSWELLQVL